MTASSDFFSQSSSRRFPERGEGEQEHEQEAAGAERRPSEIGSTRSHRACQPATWQWSMNAVKRSYISRAHLPPSINGGIDARVEIEQQPLELELPIRTRIRKRVRHA